MVLEPVPAITGGQWQSTQQGPQNLRGGWGGGGGVLLIFAQTQNILSSVPVVCDGFFQPTEQIVKEDAAGLAVNIVSVASFPELLQVIGILHNLLKKKVKYQDG